MGLKEEILDRSSKIYRDAYQMSIGELMNLYKDGELDIHPEFQRVFRWNNFQKTRLIESIMLNIPIPSIFVSQDEQGIWDVVDGVQRLSTIFQFVGIYKDEDGKIIPPLVLDKTDYLPSFEGMMWENEDSNKSFSKEQQIAFKRSRIDVIIVKKESDSNTKYELFQRLNTGGSLLSDQEVRNCLMIMTNREFYLFISELSNNIGFKESVAITDRKEDEQFRMELILRLLIASTVNLNEMESYTDLKELLDKETIKLIEKFKKNDYEEISNRFNRTFTYLNNLLGDGAFKKYVDDKPKGAFLVASFQGIATGIYNNIDTVEKLDKVTLLEKIKGFYEEDIYKNNMEKGVRAVPRFKELSLLGKEYFKNEN